MDVLRAIEKRRSIRKYKRDPIPQEKLELILEAARLAPSAGNKQPWHFVVVEDQTRKEALVKASDQHTFMSDAAAIVVAVGDPEKSANWFEKDTMIAIEHMVLAATSLGYGTCWIGAFDENELKRLLKIPDGQKVVALLPIGVPDQIPGPKSRMMLPEIFFKEEWHIPWC